MAAEELPLWRVYRGKEQWVLVRAKNEQQAVRRRKGATRAVMVHPTSYWNEQRRLGLYPTPEMRRKRRRPRLPKEG